MHKGIGRTGARRGRRAASDLGSVHRKDTLKGADSEEKHEPVGDIDTVVVDSLKALDPKRPIREADIAWTCGHVRK